MFKWQVWLGNASALGWAALCAASVVIATRWATVTKRVVRMSSTESSDSSDEENYESNEMETSPLLNIQRGTENSIYE